MVVLVNPVATPPPFLETQTNKTTPLRSSLCRWKEGTINERGEEETEREREQLTSEIFVEVRAQLRASEIYVRVAFISPYNP